MLYGKCIRKALIVTDIFKLNWEELFTRLIEDKTVSDDYSQPIGKLRDTCRNVRIQCVGRKYIRKELQWPSLSEDTNKVMKFIKKENDISDIVYGHYTNGGYIALELAMMLRVPLFYGSFTKTVQTCETS
ncbi:MAG: hypothetical protein PHE86_06110 [Candidatus Marinimicrobia bacterium]|nr:hypothetical protein [Candidatus Neomarinimicrobiota bacterium]MDD5582725.1 hypothetical protein [Candidatus Neomarinimicrobiota bacterium]